jgi:YHS domain-containing protein
MSATNDSRIVKDPICGKDVDTLRARAVGIFGGVTHYFCSQECKAKFVDPRQSGGASPPRDSGERRRAPAEPEIATNTEAPQVQYAHSRVRRVTGDVGTPVVQIDLSPNKKPAPPKEVPPDASSDELLVPARSGRGWTWIAILMLILAGGVIFFTLKHR